MSQIFFNTIDNDQYDFMTEWNTDTGLRSGWRDEDLPGS
ncbi:hypothetical protein AB46_4030 [Escherichia coli 3-267-03_S1_C2]|nr:hypothetical protein AB46_4030 [Escherichia coli 3-267-03_S1_C2]